MKIAFCVDSLINSRGTERVLSECANFLCDNCDITIITAFNCGHSDFYELDKRIRRVDLNIDPNTFSRGIPLLYNPLRNAYKNKLELFLTHSSQDIVISLGGLPTFFLPTIKDGSKKVMWFHFAFDISKIFLKEQYHNFMAQLLYKFQTYRRVRCAKQFDRLVVLSKSDLKTWLNYVNNVVCIYNPLTIKPNSVCDYKAKKAIAVGVLGVQKGFDYLIDAWKIVNKKHPDWILDIFGEGPDRDALQEQICNQGLMNHVFLRGRTSDIEHEFVNHSLFVLSSRAEGFGLVLVEAGSCGLPLVSFDCPQGPNEIIQDGSNGFLISHVGDISSLANKISLLIEDETLRQIMGSRAQEMSMSFSANIIKNKWISLFNELLS